MTLRLKRFITHHIRRKLKMMAKQKLRGLLLAILIGGIFATVATAAAQKPGTGKSVTPAAKVGEEVISVEEVVEAQRVRIERERYNLLQQKLEELIAERLLAQEAKKRGMTVEQLLKEEVDAKAPKVTEDDVTKFISKRPAQPSDQTELRQRVWDHLRSQNLNQQRQDYLQKLREKANVAVYLQEPANARVKVNSQKGFSRGPKDAPVAIVEFSDFQCSFCKGVLPTIKEIMARYPGKVKWVFRDYPIQSLHPTAHKAHEAARCAGEQGKFWEYHDLLFARSPRHSLPELKQYAGELKLASSTFSQCVETGKSRRSLGTTYKRVPAWECPELPLSLSTGACWRETSLPRLFRSSSKAS